MTSRFYSADSPEENKSQQYVAYYTYRLLNLLSCRIQEKRLVVFFDFDISSNRLVNLERV